VNKVALLAALVLALSVSDAAAQEHRGGNWNRGGGDWHQRGEQRDWHGGPRYGNYWGHHSYDPIPGVVGGAIGGWLWRQFNEPATVVVQPEPAPMPTIEWCMQRYKSYDPYTHTYLGFDGLRHGCP
jgi:hypothetical protein